MAIVISAIATFAFCGALAAEQPPSPRSTVPGPASVTTYTSIGDEALQASPADPVPADVNDGGSVATTFGPDLIVGRVFGCEQLGRVGPPGSGTIGMSCWTTACTIGDEGTNWWGLPNVDHPMISVNLFRLSSANGSDRLMQLGQSWLKHGFGTENANDCGFGCTPGGHFSLNNPGCSDTYAAFQFVPCDMGPRSMMNPYTGVMPFGGEVGPAAGCSNPMYPSRDHRDHVHTPMSHRLQVKDVDLMPELNLGAEYFSEGQYLVPHEFVAGNGTQNNNVSYRRVIVAGDLGGGFFFPEVSDTFTQQPAVNAWPGASQTLIEPAPLVDGRGFLAYKVTDLGGNVWHYEYALYNMNMDRAMGLLSIPLLADIVVSDVGFYAPLNHAAESHAENYTNTAWAVSTAGGAVTWSTDSFGGNPLANAIRFGTMYNFWFNADTPPRPMNATVGLFKTGGSVAVATVGPGSPRASDIIWNSDPLSPDRTTRSLRFRLDSPMTATGTAGQNAIKVTMVDLQHPVPPNLPAFPPPNFSGYGCAAGAAPGCTGACSPRTCVGGAKNGATCVLPAPVPTDCPAPGVCTAAVENSGCARWVGRPGTFLEDQDVPSGATYRAARLQCSPFYWDWVTETAGGPIAVVGGEIAPSSKYSVQTYGASCKGLETGCANVSAPVTMFTRRSGDVEAVFNPPGTTTQPDAIDVAQVVAKVKSLPGALVKSISQLQPNLPELNANASALDIVAAVDGAKGFAYAFSGPCTCPSTVKCGPAVGSVACANATPCVTAFGPGAMCVKTCVGGTNAGEPCIDSTKHCPGGGVCGNVGANPGFCRDRCGRCTP